MFYETNSSVNLRSKTDALDTKLDAWENKIDENAVKNWGFMRQE